VKNDSTGLRTQTATSTPRTRCVTAEGAKRHDGEKKALKRGAARFPVLVVSIELRERKFPRAGNS